MTKVKVDVMAENYHVKFFFTQLFISFVLTAELPSCERRISENGFHRFIFRLLGDSLTSLKRM